ncbi:MAG: hypothetical protein IT314_16280 [Anaerolineales bacterium]|nr:hypothetical protein [Anaerolineales bacterium]
MATSKRPSNKRDVADKEYDRAISLMQYQTGLLWQEFGAFLLAETVLIGFLGTALSQESILIRKNWLIFGGAIFGLILCIPWLSTFLHNYEFYLLRMEQAKRHEVTLGIALLTEGAELDSELSIGKKVLRQPWLARKLPPRYSVRFLIFFFSVAFGILVVISGPWYK